MRIKVDFLILFVLSIWIYIITNTTLYVREYSQHYLIEIIAIIAATLLWLTIGEYKKRRILNRVILLYIFAIFCVMFPDLIGQNWENIGSCINLLLPVYMLFLLSSVETIYLKKLAIIPMIYGLIISVQSLILEFTAFLGIEVGGNYERIEKNANSLRYVYNFGLGLQSTIFQIGGGRKLLRLNAYYLEPAKFAFFLIIPLALSFFAYKETKKKRYLVMSIIVGTAMFFTFSRAGYVSLILTYGIYRIIRTGKDTNRTSVNDVAKLIFAAAGSVLLVYVIFYMVNAISGPDASWLIKQFSWTENGRVTLIRSESSNLPDIIKRLMVRPYGYGIGVINHDGSVYDYNVANALSFWLYAGGFLGTIVIVYLLYYLISRYAIPCIKSNNSYGKAFSFMFLYQMIFSFSYGTWMNPDFIFSIGCMIIAYYSNKKPQRIVET